MTATTRAEALAENAARRQEHADAMKGTAWQTSATAAQWAMSSGPSDPPTAPGRGREPRTLTRVQVTPLDAARSRQPRRARAYAAATWTPPTRRGAKGPRPIR